MKKVVVYGADWCNNCPVVKQTWKSLSEERGDFELVFMDMDRDENIYKLRSVPTTLLFKDTVTNKHSIVVGIKTKNEFQEMLDSL